MKRAIMIVLFGLTLGGLSACCHTFAKPSPYAVPATTSGASYQ
ncbi:MAG TPA: hypothetical protein VHE99_03875 [Gammaproteobacteria bacterium]|nr:hypothetical protein [Gammaproteobacteria bacterium]